MCGDRRVRACLAVKREVVRELRRVMVKLVLEVESPNQIRFRRRIRNVGLSEVSEFKPSDYIESRQRSLTHTPTSPTFRAPLGDPPKSKAEKTRA